MITGMDKAIVGAFLPLIYAVVQQLTGMGDGPTADQIASAGDVMKTVAEMVIGGLLVYLVPNKKAA